MNTASSPALQTEKVESTIKFRKVRTLAELDGADAIRFLSIVAPDPDEFDGTWKGGTPTLYGEFVDACGARRWDVLRNACPRASLSTHIETGRCQEAIAVADNDQGPIRAVALRYSRDSRVKYFSIDLDGGYVAADVVPKLVEIFGPASLLIHSGSGTEGRYRVLGRLAEPMPVVEMQAHLHVIAACIGFPVKGGHLEVSPGNQPSRLPFGFGGCQLFDSSLRRVGEQDFDAAVSAFLNLVPIDLGSVVQGMGNPGIDTGRARTKVRFDPWTRRERPRARPKAARRLLAEGITKHGQRNRAIYEFVVDSLYSGYSCAETIARLIAWIEAGKIDASRDVQKNGRQWQIRKVERTVVNIFATTAPLGIPDPIPLTSEEIAAVKLIAKDVAARSRFPRYKVERFLLRVLPWYKGAFAAGLRMLRMHSRKWESFDRDYAELRDLTGLFRAETGYLSLATVRARRHLGARDNEAHSRSYSCRFPFRLSASDVPSYVLASQANRSGSSSDMPKDHPNVFVCKLTSTTTPKGSSVDGFSTPSPATQTRTLQLYVRHSKIGSNRRGSVSPLPSSDSQDPTIGQAPTSQPDPTFSPNARLPRRQRAVNASKPPTPVRSTSERPKVPEWRRLRNWSPPAKEGQELDEFLNACLSAKDLVREYNRERARAVRKRDLHNRNATMIRWVGIGECASERFHELRAMFGLVPWK